MLFLETCSQVIYKSVPSLVAGDVRALLRRAPSSFVLAGVCCVASLQSQTGSPWEVAAPGFPHPLSLLFPFFFPSLYPALGHSVVPALLISTPFFVSQLSLSIQQKTPHCFPQDIIASWRICWAPEEDRWLERRKGDVKDFPLLVKLNSYHGWSPFLALTLHAAQSPFSRALNHVPAFKLVVFRTKATVLNHTRTFKSFYPQAYLLSFWLQ